MTPSSCYLWVFEVRGALFLVSAVMTTAVLFLAISAPVSPSPSIVVLAGMESVGSDHVGPCYGYNRTTAPHLCRVAEDGVLFEQAYAQGTATPKSIPALFTARTPREVGFAWFTGTVLSENLTTFPEILRSKGHPVEWGYYLNSEQKPADNASNIPRLIRDAGILQGFGPSSPFESISGPVDGKPSFWFFHAPRTHYPYAPADQFRLWDDISLSAAEIRDQESQWGDFVETIPRQEVENLYDAEIREMDAKEVGGIIQHLRRAGLYRDALIIFFGDHGQAFGQHGRFAGHDSVPYEELVRVPLIMKLPGNRFAGTRVSQPVRLVDVPHTILDYLGIGTDIGSVGSSLLPVIGDAAAGFDRFDIRLSEREQPVFAGRDPTYGWMVRRGNWTYFLSNVFEVCVLGRSPRETLSPEPGREDHVLPWSEQLYYLATDPGQQQNVADEVPDVVQRLRASLCEVYNVGERNPDWFREDPLSPALQAYLEELGPPYVPAG